MASAVGFFFLFLSPLTSNMRSEFQAIFVLMLNLSARGDFKPFCSMLYFAVNVAAILFHVVFWICPTYIMQILSASVFFHDFAEFCVLVFLWGGGFFCWKSANHATNVLCFLVCQTLHVHGRGIFNQLLPGSLISLLKHFSLQKELLFFPSFSTITRGDIFFNHKP
jgi:hypothetical protein